MGFQRQKAGKLPKRVEVDFPDAPSGQDQGFHRWYFELRTAILKKLEDLLQEPETVVVKGEKGEPGESIQGLPGMDGMPGTTTTEIRESLSAVKSIMFCTAYTPYIVGADTAEIPVPFGNDGNPAKWMARKAIIRVATPGEQLTRVGFEFSRGTGVFVEEPITEAVLEAGESEVTRDCNVTVSTGDKLRFNVVELGDAKDWTVILELVVIP